MNRFAAFVVAASALAFVADARAAGVFSFAPITGDADSGISPAKTYTHAVDFAGPLNPDPGTTINGVPFQIGGRSAANYVSTGLLSELPSYSFPSNSVPAGPNTVYDLLQDFFFNGTAIDGGNESLTLFGISPGVTYTTTFFNAAFDPARSRVVDVTASDGGSILFDQNFSGDRNPSVLRYTFTATDAEITFTFDPANNGDTFHQYGFTNEVVPEPVGLIGIAVAPLLLARRRRK